MFSNAGHPYLPGGFPKAVGLFFVLSFSIRTLSAPSPARITSDL
jgi:hypothetical protein